MVHAGSVRYFFLSHDEDIRIYAETSNITAIDESTDLFLQYAKAKQRFYQLQFINETGQELIRIYYDPEVSDYVAMPNYQLSNVSNFPYFKTTTGFPDNDLYASEILHVNTSSQGISNEVIIIYATPVINSTGVMKGIVVVCLTVDKLLDDIQKKLIRNMEEPEYFIVDQDGYYIYNYKNSHKEFAKYHGIEENLRKDYPKSSPEMLSGTDGQIMDIQMGLADFQTYHFNPANLSQYIVIIGVNKFALIYQILLDGIVISIGAFSYIFLIYAYRNFIKGDFKKLLSFMILILTFIGIYKTLEILELYYQFEGLFLIEQTALILSILMIIGFAWHLLEFSKMYGFADKKTFKK